MVDSNDIKQNLINLGLDENEVTVYIELLNSDSQSILEVSKAVNIPRTTVYRLCEKLVDKKFAEWIIHENSQRIKAVRPLHLKFLIEEKKTELEITENALTTLQSMISENINSLPKTEVRYYQGKEGLKQMIWNCLRAKKEVVGYSVYGRREVTGETFYTKYVEEFRLRKIKDRTVVNEEALNYIKGFMNPQQHQQNFDEIRFLPKSKFYVKGDISIYNNIYAVSLWREGEVVGIEIENPEIVKMQKSIFEILWGIAEPIGKYL